MRPSPSHIDDVSRIRTPRGALADLGRALGEALLETVWPTRCAVCDEPDSLLCERCRLRLPYIDRWQACERCGAPFGRFECTECNPIMLAHDNRDELPFRACASSVVLDDRTRRIVTLHKDAGERRLAGTMAHIMAKIVDPAWIAGDTRPTLAWVPASKTALRRRGFDHAEAIARELAGLLGLPARALLERPASQDQRALSRSERFSNMQGRFRAAGGAFEGSQEPGCAVILVDDVYTTGATIAAATDALLAAGATEVRCLTFARAL